MSGNPSRRQLLKRGVAVAAASAMTHTLPAAVVAAEEKKTADPNVSVRLPDNALTHGGIQRCRHPRLGVDVIGQTCIRYLRFGRPVVLSHLELGRHVYGRWIPDVPVHPAHLIISRLDGASLK